MNLNNHKTLCSDHRSCDDAHQRLLDITFALIGLELFSIHHHQAVDAVAEILIHVEVKKEHPAGCTEFGVLLVDF